MNVVFYSKLLVYPQQNGRVERKHRHIHNVARALMFQGDLPLRFWGKCILGAMHLINRTPSGVLHNKTPIEVLTGKVPAFDHLRIFGSLCFAHDQRSKGNKFAPRSRKCIFLGYPSHQKGWKLYDIDSRKFFVSRDVQFHESEFPFAKCSPVSPLVSSPRVADVEPPVGDVEAAPSVGYAEPETATEPVAAAELPSNASVGADLGDAFVGADLGDASVGADLGESSSTLKRGMRTKHPSILFKDYIMHTVVSPPFPSSSSSGTLGSSYPLAHYVNCSTFYIPHRAFLAAVLTGIEPRTFNEAMSDPGWRKAMALEIEAPEANVLQTQTHH
ncbi:hypothetical protein LIER_32223 [Lithospermum erythrorhizon]|uniref:Retroviral polymerase SH3-like domain-containing protein n=1 Tax=Lithospermum erythrorhizon TaxID=34254 RepID=A0AAV3RWE1_LITER